MIWATRRHVHVDRTACAWLIRRFIDPEAQFVFVDDPDEVPPGVTPFDMRGVELGHRDGRCSFESVLVRYELGDAALHRMGRIVHEADIGDARHDAPEAAGLDAIVRGLAVGAADDDERIVRTAPLYALWSASS
ncbi:MAG TPA: chromate resistance protein ChrB domain-containing protein [Gaiellales bacterium]|jgi:hypothetical protein|nr:chromate resistance protein ChrB domain-containing protein [Gaiellales bacterium]